MTYIASRASNKNIRKMQKAFLKLDTKKNGTIGIGELIDALGMKEPPKKLKIILKGVDTDHNGKISYTEFLAATVSRDLFRDDDNIEDAFKIFDRNDDGFITATEIKAILGGEDG